MWNIVVTTMKNRSDDLTSQLIELLTCECSSCLSPFKEFKVAVVHEITGILLILGLLYLVLMATNKGSTGLPSHDSVPAGLYNWLCCGQSPKVSTLIKPSYEWRLAIRDKKGMTKYANK
ncbi:hypothetical protein M8C21_013771 [Ambrosia artemisiifolia]|uniref:Uncharacterized protein n=1 Tax=Ambrosia artemisiifolia TaxID=4212 RepID=A0AAD5GEQ1_AMBAR|nr:hypothetical protein M8C21_013771 [Ambrosia artemisiifolia]